MRKLSWKRTVALTGLVLVVLLGVIVGIYFWQMRMLKPYEVDMGAMDHAGHSAGHAHGSAHAALLPASQPARLCSAITEQDGQEPVREFRLAASQSSVVLDDGGTERVWAFNGRVPGPEIRVTEGERVRVVLDNHDIQAGVTVHWHGIVLPCSQDGVAGVTQDAVKPGERFTYEFVAGASGTYWYHSHQASSVQVEKGLLGAFIVEPREREGGHAQEEVVLIQQLNGTYLLNGSAKGAIIAAAPGTKVRIRMINAANETDRIRVSGASYRVMAMDGHELYEPGLLERHEFRMGAGQRYDLLLQMPAKGKVVIGTETGLTVTLGEGAEPDLAANQSLFDWTRYGKPDPSAPLSQVRVDRSYTLKLGQNLFINTINGKSFHEIPPLIVREGERLKLTITNASGGDHPFHLHGHVFRVLSRNGQPLSGTPVLLDTLLTHDGETYEVYVQADNPGLWMMHCHNLMHASMGMSMMMNYEGIATPYRVGTKSGNLPDL
ncbi:multicopper oxidase family protein [Paenibacillus xanthanilyticus]|uniref:Copper-containing nitrite reductase n=1 Tax=Paenibacillus xanthanilyticus TaxID=1783531 RepID=A0ABV8K901_9BACL